MKVVPQTLPQVLKESTAYFVSFTHLKNGAYCPENTAFKNPYVFKIFSLEHVKIFEVELVKMGYIEPKVNNFIPIGLESNAVAKPKIKES